MTNENLYLIGTVHIDLKGHERLEGLLKHLSPDIVALEFHKDREAALTEQRKKSTSESEEKEVDDVFREAGIFLNTEQRRAVLEQGRITNSVMGYEVTISKDYIKSNSKSRLEYIDISVFENGVEEFQQGYLAAIKGTLAMISQSPELKDDFLKFLNKGKRAFLKQAIENVDEVYKNSKMLEELVEVLKNPEIFESMKEVMPSNAIQTLKQIYNPERDKAMANRIKKLYDKGSR